MVGKLKWLHPAVAGWKCNGKRKIRLVAVISPTKVILSVPSRQVHTLMFRAPEGWAVKARVGSSNGKSAFIHAEYVVL